MSIVFRDVHKAFGSKEVLRGFDLEAREGETLVVMGASGAGKSVTLKHIVGLIRPDRGSIEVDGRSVEDMVSDDLYDLRRNVGYVFQFAALFDSMTISENVGLGLRRVEGMTEERIARRVEECLGLVDLEGYGDQMPAQLSGGQKKRAGLARAIATKPQYVLYDEPTTGLDPLTRSVIDGLILRLADELGVTGVVITHDMESAFRVADRMAMIHEGRIRAVGTPEEFRNTEDPIVKGFIEGRPELMEGVA